MAQAEDEMLAACGLDCGPCPIRRMPFDAQAAEETIAWFKEMGWLKEVVNRVRQRFGAQR
jgi:hypothetical protein